MLTIEHKSFLLESYFRNGVKLENGEWSYSVQVCFEEFQEHFINHFSVKNFAAPWK
ncbi:hypothetical protein BDFB_014799 [Asbolus verrucosus]|uniref:Uncharacterized protein n=1 Tax=Asbolus verrucosus TaxID=1661398 RepID=A0A482VFC4_ASBVE|nr:hypothetical protein BDFB_014799 [Asbolus verrucosus]